MRNRYECPSLCVKLANQCIDAERTIKIVHISQCSLQIHVFQPSENSAYERLATNPSDANEEYSAGTLSELPSRELEGLWESLFYDGDVKSSLLNYIQATISLSDANVDCKLVQFFSPSIS